MKRKNNNLSEISKYITPNTASNWDIDPINQNLFSIFLDVINIKIPLIVVLC